MIDALFYNEHILPSILCEYLYIHDADIKKACMGSWSTGASSFSVGILLPIL